MKSGHGKRAFNKEKYQRKQSKCSEKEESKKKAPCVPKPKVTGIEGKKRARGEGGRRKKKKKKEQTR